MSGNRRFNLQWNRDHLAVFLVLSILFAGLLVRRGAERTRLVAERIAPDPARFAAARETVDPNTASVGSLRRLSGIGPAKARAIVNYRRQGGVFRNLQDLQDVHGIGPALSNRNASQLRFDASGAKTGNP